MMVQQLRPGCVALVLSLAFVLLSPSPPAWSSEPRANSPEPAASAGAGRDKAAVADLSGVRLFLDLTALLERDEDPAPERWDALFATPGYAVLTSSEFRKEFFIERFRLAFMPSKKADLEAQLKRDATYLPHYLKAKASRAEIERRVKDLESADFDTAIARAKALRPPGVNLTGTPRVAFVVFAADGRGYDPVVLDILFKTRPDEFVDLAAHEFHHWYRRRIAVDFDRDARTLWVINQVHLEGIADQINVPAWIDRPAETLEPPDRQFVEFYARSPEIIREMDRFFTEMDRQPARRRELGAQLVKVVPKSGHPTGYYMAETIVKVLGRDALAKTTSNPFAFFRVYNEAARRKGKATPFFSKPAMTFLASLERRYVE